MVAKDNAPDPRYSLGELKAIIGKLWKSVDAMKIAAQADSSKVGEKLDVWIQTNHLLLASNQELMKAVLLNSQEVQRSSRSYEQGSQLLLQLQQQLQSLSNATTELSKISASSPAAAVADKGQPSHPLTPEALEKIQQGLNQALLDLKNLQGIFSKSVEVQIQKLDEWSQENADILPQTPTPPPKNPIWSGSFHSPKSIGMMAGVAIALVGTGAVIATLVPRNQDTLTTGQPIHLTQEEVDLLRWANTDEGKLARNLMRWNNHKLSSLSCLDEVSRLGVTLSVDGRPAVSGFCTIWVVPPAQRKFQD